MHRADAVTRLGLVSNGASAPARRHARAASELLSSTAALLPNSRWIDAPV